MMTEREEVANKLQRLIAAYKAFKRMRRHYPSVGRERMTAAIIAEIDRKPNGDPRGDPTCRRAAAEPRRHG